MEMWRFVTMIKISENFGSSAPNAYIKSIKIAQGPSIVASNNPSSRQPYKVNEFRDRDGNTTYAPKRTSLKQSKPGSTSVNMSVSIKDSINGRTKKGTWTSSTRAQQNYKLNVLLVFSEELEREIIRQNSLDSYPIKIPSKFSEFLDWQQQTVPLITRGGNLQTSYADNATGNKVASKEYNFSFNVPYSDLNHLTSFVFCEFITPNVKTSTANVHSMVTIEKIIRNSNTVNTATFYTTQNGDLWTGPVHVHEGRPMEGAIHTNRPHNFLTSRSIFNFKTQDLRVFDEIDNLKIDISPNLQQYQTNYISNLYLGRMKNGGASFVFNFDHLSFLVRNSKFGKLLQKAPDSLRKQLMVLSPITNMTLTRDRVRQIRGQNSLLSSDLREYDFDTQNVPRVVVSSSDQDGVLIDSIQYSYSGENSGKYFQVKAQDEQPDDLMLTGRITEIAAGGVGTTRTFSGMDGDVALQTDGVYQYSLKIDVFDGIQNYMNNKIEELKAAITSMEQYIQLSRLVGNYNSITDSFTPQFISLYGKNQQSLIRPWMASIAVFVDVLGLVTDISLGERQNIVTRLYSCLDPNVSNPSINLRFIEQMRNLLNNLMSLSGKPKQLHTRNKSAANQIASTINRLSVSSTFSEVFSVEAPTDTAFDYLTPTEPKQVQMLNISAKDLKNRVEMEIDRYCQAPYTQDELADEFCYLTGDVVEALVTDNSDLYIAPETFSVGGTSIDLLSPNKDSLDYITTTAVIQDVVYSPSSKGATTQPTNNVLEVLNFAGQGPSKDRLNKINNLYVSVASTNNIIVNSLNIDFEPDLENLVSSEEFLGKNNKFSADVQTIESNTKKKQKENFSNAVSVINDALSLVNISFETNKKLNATPLPDISFNLQNENNYINKRIVPSYSKNGQSAEKIASLPNQIKRLTLSKENVYKGSSATLTTNEDAKNDGFIYNFGMLRQVEYLNGYRNGFIKDPKWTALTEQTLSSMKEPLICRVRKFNDPDVNVGSFEAMDQVPVNNEYFLVNPDSPSPRTQMGPMFPRIITNSKNNLGYEIRSFNRTSSGDFLSQLINLENQKALIQDQIEFTVTELPAAPTGLGGKISGLKKR
jgi:hypothetical protein